MIAPDETLIGPCILAALRGIGWLRPRPLGARPLGARSPEPPPPPPPEPPRYTCTLRGVTYDRRHGVLKTHVHYVDAGQHRRMIYLANAAPSPENERRLHAMWLAARAVRDAGGDAVAIREAARRVGARR